MVDTFLLRDHARLSCRCGTDVASAPDAKRAGGYAAGPFGTWSTPAGNDAKRRSSGLAGQFGLAGRRQRDPCRGAAEHITLGLVGVSGLLRGQLDRAGGVADLDGDLLVVGEEIDRREALV